MDEERIIEETTSENSIGSVRIASDVVATIAGMAAADVPGIAGMSGGVVGGIAEMLGRKNLTKGVKVEVGDAEASIDLFVIVDYGIAIADVARQVQQVVKSTVESMTGLVCSGVNIHVQGVMFPQQKPEEQPAE